VRQILGRNVNSVWLGKGESQAQWVLLKSAVCLIEACDDAERQATKATLFYNNARKRIGLVGFWDTIAFDEVAGIKIRDPDTIQIMKDFLANGRFSRGVEVIADASMAFVGNIDHSIEQIVNSTEYDLFLCLPPEFDLAVMDRLACYLAAGTHEYQPFCTPGRCWRPRRGGKRACSPLGAASRVCDASLYTGKG
jgi:hypothetical protein